MKNNNLTLVSLFLTLSILFSVSGSIPGYAQGENQTIVEPQFLSLQHAQAGSISAINETTYSLELNDVSDKTILFSDRPDRIVTTVSTLDFIGNWSAGQDSFAADPPNAVLVVEEVEKQDTIIVELFNLVYDFDKKALKYGVIPGNVTSIDLPNKFGQSMVIIDTSGQPVPIT